MQVWDTIASAQIYMKCIIKKLLICRHIWRSSLLMAPLRTSLCTRHLVCHHHKSTSWGDQQRNCNISVRYLYALFFLSTLYKFFYTFTELWLSLHSSSPTATRLTFPSWSTIRDRDPPRPAVLAWSSGRAVSGWAAAATSCGSAITCCAPSPRNPRPRLRPCR